MNPEHRLRTSWWVPQRAAQYIRVMRPGSEQGDALLNRNINISPYFQRAFVYWLLDDVRVYCTLERAA